MILSRMTGTTLFRGNISFKVSAEKVLSDAVLDAKVKVAAYNVLFI